MKIKKMPLVVILLVGLLGCGESADSAFDRGYGDGYARGFNSICYPNASNMIHGDFENRNYQRGYNEGEADGRAECLSQQQ